MGKQQREKGMKNAQAAYIKSSQDAQQNSTFGKSCGADMIAQLKRLALDPCQPQFAPENIKPFMDQILRLKKSMRLTDSRVDLRKRKHEKIVNDGSVATSANQQNTSAAERRLPSPILFDSCMVSSTASDKSSDDKLRHKSGNLSSLTLDETLSNKEPQSSGKDMSVKVCSNESESVSNPSSLKKLKSNEFKSGSKPSSLRKLKSKATKHLQRKNVIGPSKSSKATRTTKPLQPPESCWLQTLMDSYDVSKNVIPVCPKFQADVPEWNDPVDENTLIGAYRNDFDVNKWLGTRTWPLKSREPKHSERGIGQGRPNTCLCASPGSVDCVKGHIVEDRKLLQSELGSAFFSWKFHEMGDQILKSWTVKERETFESMVKKKPHNKNFLKLTLKHLNKRRADVVSYYFNVYIPERMSVQTRSSSPVQIDTDEDEEDCKYMGVQKRASGKKKLLLSKSKGVKTRRFR